MTTKKQTPKTKEEKISPPEEINIAPPKELLGKTDVPISTSEKPATPDEATKPNEVLEETFVDRLKKEQSDLSEKVVKLAEFRHTQAFDNLDTTNRTLLKKQLQLMSEYLGILDQRLAICNTKQ